MGNEQSGFGRKLRSLFQNKEQSTPEQPLPEEPPIPEETQTPPESPDQRELATLPGTEGALTALWRLWNEADPAPEQCMLGDRTELPFDGATLRKERLKLSIALERDAKKRLQAVTQAAEGEQTLGPQCQIYRSENRMAAWLFVFPPTGQEGELPFETVAAALEEAAVTTGIDSAAIASLLGGEPYFHLIPVAVGTPPTEGKDGYVVEHFQRELKQEVKVDEHGEADYRAQNYVQMVQAGAVLCEIVAPVPGVAGLRVDGTKMEPKPVRTETVPVGQNTELTDNGSKLVATKTGHLEYINKRFQVKQVFEVQGDVDYRSGNVDYEGDVHIYGDVRDNFSVRATGTITIDGLVEGATIEAGGDLVIASGVLGNYKAVVRSGGCIRVKYLENCVAYAKKSVIADCIMTSQVFTDERVEVMNGRGAIIGGEITAACEVKARLVGSQAGRRTQITLGVRSFVEDELVQREEELTQLREEIAKLDQELERLVERVGVGEAPKELSKVQLDKSVLTLKELQMSKQIDDLRAGTIDLGKCRLEAGIVYPITEVYMDRDCRLIDTTENNCKLKYDMQNKEIIKV